MAPAEHDTARLGTVTEAGGAGNDGSSSVFRHIDRPIYGYAVILDVLDPVSGVSGGSIYELSDN